jgi:hypothetical protein
MNGKNDVRVWYLLLIVSLGGLGFWGLSKKKICRIIIID